MFQFDNAAILSVAVAEAPIVVTSAEIDEALAETYSRLRMRAGMLEAIAGIVERRWWPEDVSFADAAAMAGAKAIAAAGVDPQSIGLLINTSVCKTNLEPSAAVDVHHQLELPTSAINFDLSNACLGFVNGMQLAGMMIDSGQIDYALIVDGEGSRLTQERTIARLQAEDTTTQDFLDNFATLTLGSGGAAMVLGRASDHSDAHRFVGGAARAATEHHLLCVGDLEHMQTDSRALLEAGIDLSTSLWSESASAFGWSELDTYIMHQVSNVHTAAITKAINIDPERVPLTFPHYGNIGPASIPFTLAQQLDDLSAGDRVGCLGIGSGLNACVIEIEW